MIFVGSVACQNSGMYTLRMIVTVAYLDTAHDFPKGSNTLCHLVEFCLREAFGLRTQIAGNADIMTPSLRLFLLIDFLV